MNYIDIVLRANGARMYDVWSANEKKNPQSGSVIKTYNYLTNIFAVIQPTGSLNTVKGRALSPTQNSGDKITSDLVMYCKNERFEKERVLYKNLFYEIRSVEYYDNGILKYYKAHLVKVDNQNDKHNQG